MRLQFGWFQYYYIQNSAKLFLHVSLHWIDQEIQPVKFKIIVNKIKRFIIFGVELDDEIGVIVYRIQSIN
jgi:hypothetical protein